MNETLWIVFDGFFVLQEGIKRSRQNVVVSADLRFRLPFIVREAIFSSVVLFVITQIYKLQIIPALSVW